MEIVTHNKIMEKLNEIIHEQEVSRTNWARMAIGCGVLGLIFLCMNMFVFGVDVVNAYTPIDGEDPEAEEKIHKASITRFLFRVDLALILIGIVGLYLRYKSSIGWLTIVN